MANYVIGSTDRKWLEPRGAPAGMDLSSDGEWVRAGELHAVPAGAGTALCGADVAWMWTEEAWPPGMAPSGARCLTCTDLAGQS